MAFNTGNPLGSTDPRDFSDNSENFDRLANGQNAAYTDRFGNQRKSFSAMEYEFAAFIAASGYEFVGDYAAGITITGYQQVVRDVSGEFWRLDGATNLPYTTTGAGLPEGGAFVSVGDAALRQDLNGALASSLGATIVNGATIYVGSVAELEALPSPITGREAMVSGSPFIYDGAGWAPSGDSITPQAFGAVGDGVADDTAALNDARDYAALHNVFVDLGTDEYLISSQYTLPQYLEGRGAKITGADGYAQTRKFAEWSGVTFDTLILNGVWHSDMRNITTTKCILRGFSTSWGSFYNEFKNCDFGSLEINVQEFAVNQNTFINCHAKSGAGTGLTFTDGNNTTAPFREAHNNTFIGCDFSYGPGVSNTTELQQTNNLVGCYVEGGAEVSGPFDIRSMNMDSLKLPEVGLMNHIIGMTEQIERTGADYLSMTRNNLVPGGEWGAMDANGVPVGISATFGATVNTNASGKGWWGIDKQYGGSTSTDFKAINIAIPVLNTPRVTVCGFWIGDLPASVTYDGKSLSPAYIELEPGIYLFRLTVRPASIAANLSLFVTTTGGVTRTGHLGAVYVSPFKTGLIPFVEPLASSPVKITRANGTIRATGVTALGYQTTSPVVLTFDYAAAGYSSNPHPRGITIEADNSAFANKVQKVIVTNRTTTETTAELYFATDFIGNVYWEVEGV